jgi:glyoxylate/hydroxypyruvate reductase
VGGPKKTVGFLGFGRIAQATLNRLVGFGIARCIYTTRVGSPPKKALEDSLTEKYRTVNPTFEGVRQVDLKTLARESDVLFVLAPGGAETRHIVNKELLKGMKRTSVLVNTSRGSLVDSDALAQALRDGWIWGAGLDVVEGEPDVSADHPLVKEPR